MTEPMRSSSGLRLAPANPKRSFVLPVIVVLVLTILGIGLAVGLGAFDGPASTGLLADRQSSGDDVTSPSPSLETPSDVTRPPAIALQPPSPVEPSFDIVQVDRDGQTVAAGRAEPGAVVQVYRNGAVVAEVSADDRGEWVWTPIDPLPPGNQVLQLRVNQADGGILASQPIVVLGGQTAVELADPDGDEVALADGEPRAVIALGDTDG
ncbi:MAG: hypothetical protein AAF556_12435, partial [Pseudomonadota bacterium]